MGLPDNEHVEFGQGQKMALIDATAQTVGRSPSDIRSDIMELVEEYWELLKKVLQMTLWW